MNDREKVRFKASSALGEQLHIPPGALGAVLCRYRLLREKSATHRLDVRFGPHLVVWGAPESQFEAVDDEKRAR